MTTSVWSMLEWLALDPRVQRLAVDKAAATHVGGKALLLDATLDSALRSRLKSGHSAILASMRLVMER